LQTAQLKTVKYMVFQWWYLIPILFLIVLIHDLFFSQKHSILRNFPIVGHLRYLLEKVGPELRQYIVANNREELPFNRSERSWVYASSKKENNYQAFGSDQDQTATNYLFIQPELFPFRVPAGHPNESNPYLLPSAKVMGLARGRKRPFRPYSMINVSAMSFGSLSAAAISALNKGAAKSGAYHNTGEGGLSPYHKFGADVIFHFGTGYFGVRDEAGNFSMDKLKRLVEDHPQVRAIELKLSQGAKPGKGGVLPGKKITAEIAEIRGVEKGKDVLSPAFHSSFSTVQEMVDFIELMAEETGLPVGIKSAVGKMELWESLCDIIQKTGKGPDFITIDGGEGGTGAAPPSFANHMSLPFMYGFSKVYALFQARGLEQDIVWIASGKLGFPSKAAMAYALGADIINVAREAMMSIGCIQAQTCHTNFCPTGVATQNPWLQHGLHVGDKSERFYHYIKTFRKEFLEITHAAGYEHPTQFKMSDIRMNTSDQYQSKGLNDIFSYEKSEVPFSGMKSLIECDYLGGKASQPITEALKQ
jgi:glutamate synthase domain-containing protein 2